VGAARKAKKRTATIQNACFINISKTIINIKRQGLNPLLNIFVAAKEMSSPTMKIKNLSLFTEIQRNRKI
jgi:hypothetical protein